jgi:spermidine/putrescine transport system permease protein
MKMRNYKRNLLIFAATAPVMAFMFLPVIATILLSFNISEYGGFPLTELTTKWYANLFDDEALIGALKSSILIGSLSAVLATVCGTAAAYAVSRYFQGRSAFLMAYFTLPILIPHIVLGVGVLLLFNMLGLPKTMLTLICGHTAMTAPFVFSTMLSRFAKLPRQYEEAAVSLGASPLIALYRVTLPIAFSAIVASCFFAFSMSFDEVTATMFWKPSSVDTIPTLVLGMLQNAISPALNAMATLLIFVTVIFPLLGASLRKKHASKR